MKTPNQPSAIHPEKIRVIQSSAKLNILATPRRWGKTDLAIRLATSKSALGGKVLYIAATYHMVKPVREALSTYRVDTIASGYPFPSGPYDLIIADEAEFYFSKKLLKDIRGNLTPNGVIWFLSTPRPGGNFVEFLLKATGKKNCATWFYPTIEDV